MVDSKELTLLFKDMGFVVSSEEALQIIMQLIDLQLRKRMCKITKKSSHLGKISKWSA